MRKVKYKWFWAWSFDKEEKWLKEMSAKGLTLVDVGFCRYAFEEGTPGEYDVRVELLENFPGHPESMRYIRFVEDTGAEYIGSVNRWVYFRKKAELGGFDLFSDIDSRTKHINRVQLLTGVVFMLMLVNIINIMRLYVNYSRDTAVLVMAIVCGVLTVILGIGFGRISMMKRKLKKARALHE